MINYNMPKRRLVSFFLVLSASLSCARGEEKILAFASTSPRSPSSSVIPVAGSTWVDRVHELVEYREHHGNTMVPKRYQENPALGNWVNKQRVLYRKYCANETPCSLTKEKIDILNQIGFVWDGKQTATEGNTGTTVKQESAWWKRLEELQEHYSSNNSLESLPPSLSRWIRQQRQEYEKFQGSDKECKLDKQKLDALNDVDPKWWKTFHQRRWDQRCRELIKYRQEHGDCCVPITYEKNKKLANWVSNCRKNYNLFHSGEKSNLTEEKIKELEKIGFVWNRWDYEFDKKRK